MWGYKVHIIEGQIIDGSELEKSLNEFGCDGWELVNIIPQISSETDYATGDVDIDISCCAEVYVSQNILIFKKKQQ